MKDKKTRAGSLGGLPGHKKKKYLPLWPYRHLAFFLIVAGSLIVSYTVIARVYSVYRQQQLVYEYESSIEKTPETPLGEDNDVLLELSTAGQKDDVADDPTVSSRTSEEEPADSVSQDEAYTLLGVLTIPKISLSVAIGENVENSTLKYAVGHFVESTLPGNTGNCCIAGHRNYTWGEFFNRLDEVVIGDEILVECSGTSYSYTVTEVFVVDPEDTWVLDQTENAQITLITCTPIHVATQRLIVRGTLTN